MVAPRLGYKHVCSPVIAVQGLVRVDADVVHTNTGDHGALVTTLEVG